MLLPPNKLLPPRLRLELQVDLADAPWRERRLPWATLLQRRGAPDGLHRRLRCEADDAARVGHQG